MMYLLWSGIAINALAAFWLIFGIVSSVRYQIKEWRKAREDLEEKRLKEEFREENSNGESQV